MLEIPSWLLTLVVTITFSAIGAALVFAQKIATLSTLVEMSDRRLAIVEESLLHLVSQVAAVKELSERNREDDLERERRNTPAPFNVPPGGFGRKR